MAYKSRSQFPVIRDVSNILGQGPWYHDITSNNVSENTRTRRAKWCGGSQKLRDKAKKLLKEKYPEAEVYDGGYFLVYHKTTLTDEVKAAQQSDPEQYKREVKAAGDIEMELDCAVEASSGGYMEPSCLDRFSQDGNTIEVTLKNGGVYRLTVEEIEAPNAE